MEPTVFVGIIAIATLILTGGFKVGPFSPFYMPRCVEEQKAAIKKMKS